MGAAQHRGGRRTCRHMRTHRELAPPHGSRTESRGTATASSSVVRTRAPSTSAPAPGEQKRAGGPAAPASLSAQAQRRAWQWQTSTTVGDRLALAGWPGGDKRGCDRGAQPPVACSPDLSRSQRACLLVPERGRTHHTHMAGRASRQSRLALPQHRERERLAHCSSTSTSPSAGPGRCYGD